MKRTQAIRKDCFRSVSVWLALLAIAAMPQTFAQQAAKPSANLSGVWLLTGNGMGGGNAVLAKRPQSQWSTETLPFSPQGLKVFQANKPGKGPRQIKPALGNDPIGKANPYGLYRTLVYGRPFEFVQLPDKVLQVFEVGRNWRAMYTDGRPVPDDVPAGPYWYGYSVGRWDGDVLMVITMALDDRAWMDEWGTPFSAEARFEERWQRIAPDRIQLTITVHDSVTYTRPWTTSPLIYTLQKKGVEPQEVIFAPIDEAAFNEDIRDPAGLPK
jgi:hypothetical protein